MQRIIKILLMLLLVCLTTTSSYAGWTGPSEVISETWGTTDNQVGFKPEDTVDAFPEGFWILGARIVIRDQENRRIKIYGINGVQEKIVNWAKQANGSFKIPEYALAGDLAGYMADNLVTYYSPQQYYVQYSPTGQLLQTYTERPLELGKVSEKPINSTTTKVTVQYPDKTWSYTDVGRMSSYMRDTNGNLYGYGNTQVIRYATCGKEAAMLMMPKKIVQETSRGPQIEPQVTVLEEYGTPVIAPNGDVYTWKRTPTTYSILKWTWADDPSVPANGPDTPGGFSLKTTSTGINLFWNAVPQDPGCLTGYELVRSTIAGGPYSALATVIAGTANATGWIKYTDTTAEVGTMYYYKVRAVAGTEYSQYTAEVTGKR